MHTTQTNDINHLKHLQTINSTPKIFRIHLISSKFDRHKITFSWYLLFSDISVSGQILGVTTKRTEYSITCKNETFFSAEFRTLAKCWIPSNDSFLSAVILSFHKCVEHEYRKQKFVREKQSCVYKCFSIFVDLSSQMKENTHGGKRETCRPLRYCQNVS